MSILHVIGTIILYILFLMIKKTDKKQSIIFWGVMGIVLLLGLNIFICTMFGIMKIKNNLSFITGIYVLISGLFFIKILKTNEFQKYTITKYELILSLFMIVLTVFIVLKERDFFSGELKYGVTDSAIHYKAAKHFSYNFDLLINIEDKTAYDFNYMQTGAYITDGIFMKVIRELFNVKDYYIYSMFETFIFFINGMLFLCLIKDYVKTIYGLFFTKILLILYMYGYVYESFLMGFSYLSVGLLFILGIYNIILGYYKKNLEDGKKVCANNFSNKWMICCISILSFGLIFSYSLFVPAIFSSIVIILFIRGIIEKKKRFLKVIDYETLIVLGILIVITVIGIMYLLVPTYIYSDIEELGSAIANYGYVPDLEMADYIYYIPFIILFVIYSIKNRENLEISILVCLASIFTIVMFVLNSKEIVSNYYLSKVYFYDWILIFYMNIYAVSNIKNDALKRVFSSYTVAFCTLIIMGMYVNSNSNLFGGKTLNTAGMYYYENCYRRDFIDRRYTFTNDEIKMAEYIKNIPDINVDNTLILAKNNYHIYWVWSIADFEESKDPTNLFTNFAADYKNEKNVEDKFKYIIILEEEGDKENYIDDFKIVYQNKDAVLLKRK